MSAVVNDDQASPEEKEELIEAVAEALMNSSEPVPDDQPDMNTGTAPGQDTTPADPVSDDPDPVMALPL